MPLLDYAIGSLTYGLGSAPDSVFEQDLIAYLGARTGIALTLGKIPQFVNGIAATFLVTGADRDYRLSGPSGPVQVRVEIEVSSRDYLDCARISTAIRKALTARVRYQMAGTFVDACLLEDESSDYAPPVNSSDRGTFSKSGDYVFRLLETN